MNNVEKTVMVILAGALIVVSVVVVYGYFVNSTVYSNYGLYGSSAQGVTGYNGGNYPQSGTYGPYGNSAPYSNNYGSYSGYGTYGNPGPYTNNAPWGAYGGFGGGMMGRGMIGGFW